MSHGACECFYSLDAQDRIADWGGPSWSRFATENAGARLAVRDLRGERIYDHVAGHFTQRFLRQFFVDVRRAEAPLERTYRCDSPSVKRLMRMRASRVGEFGLRVEQLVSSA